MGPTHCPRHCPQRPAAGGLPLPQGAHDHPKEGPSFRGDISRTCRTASGNSWGFATKPSGPSVWECLFSQHFWVPGSLESGSLISLHRKSLREAKVPGGCR